MTCFFLRVSVASEESMSKGIKMMENGIQKMKLELKQHAKPQSRVDKFTEKMKVYYIGIILFKNDVFIMLALCFFLGVSVVG